MGTINCCKDCVPPKRTPSCHSTCEEYLKEKADHEVMREKAALERRIKHGLKEQRDKAVFKAYRKGRH